MRSQTLRKQVGKRIKIARKDAGFTQATFAKKIHSLRPNVANYEVGRVHVPSDVLVKIARTLKVSSDHLLGLNKSGGGTA